MRDPEACDDRGCATSPQLKRPGWLLAPREHICGLLVNHRICQVIELTGAEAGICGQVNAGPNQSRHDHGRGINSAAVPFAQALAQLAP